MTILIAFATHSGATRTLAEQIADTLTAEGLVVELADVAADPDPAAYSATVIGSGIRIDAYERTFTRWADAHAEALASRPVALFSCSGSASDPAKHGHQKGTDAFLEHSGLTPVAVQNFPGWVLMDRIPLHERIMLKTMRTPEGDFRDLDAVAAWARGIAPMLRG